jgi:hypothetical protein
MQNILEFAVGGLELSGFLLQLFEGAETVI